MNKDKEIINKLTIGSYKCQSECVIKKNFKDFYDKIDLIGIGRTWKESLYMYIYNIDKIPTCECGNLVEYQSYSKGYRQFCSRGCMNESKYIKEKRANTNIKKYGGTSPMHNEQVKQKLSNVMMEKYGVDNISKLVETKEKVRQTNLKNTGYEYNSQRLYVKKVLSENMKKNSPLYREKIIEKYGMIYTKTKEGIEKVKRSTLEKYGVSNIQFNENFRKNNDYFVLSKHENYVKYIGDNISLFKCDNGKDHEFEIHSNNYRSRKDRNIPLCTICNPIGDMKSIKEKMVLEYIRSIYDGEVISGYRDGLEIDIYLPELSIGFEFNGLYWHSTKFRDKNYHLNKLNYFKERGIQLFFIWKDDWDFKTEIVKSMILDKLNISFNTIDSDKGIIEEIENDELVKDFLDTNYIRGYVNVDINLGFYYENDHLQILLSVYYNFQITLYIS